MRQCQLAKCLGEHRVAKNIATAIFKVTVVCALVVRLEWLCWIRHQVENWLDLAGNKEIFSTVNGIFMQVQNDWNTFLAEVCDFILNCEGLKLNNVLNMIFVSNSDFQRSFNNVQRRTSHATTDFVVTFFALCRLSTISRFSWAPLEMKLSEEIHFMQGVVLHPLLNNGAHVDLILSFDNNHFTFSAWSASCLQFCELVVQVAKDWIDVP